MVQTPKTRDDAGACLWGMIGYPRSLPLPLICKIVLLFYGILQLFVISIRTDGARAALGT